ncbi:MAG: hypothetical protein ACFN9G_01405 [Cardiobacterium sp.]
MSITPIILTADDKQTCINSHGICERKGHPKAGTVFRILRAGTPHHFINFIKYPLTDGIFS